MPKLTKRLITISGMLTLVISLMIITSVMAASAQTGGKVAIDEVQLVDGVEVELISAKSGPNGVTIEYSYRSQSGGPAHQLGISTIIKSDGTRAEATEGKRTSDDKLADFVPLQSGFADSQQPVTVDLGSIIVFDTTTAGTVALTLGTNYLSVIDSTHTLNSKLPLNGTLSVDDAQYNVIALVVDRESLTRNFMLVVVPVNDVAKRIELAAGPASASLTDDKGNNYALLTTRTRWTRDNNGRHEVASQYLRFEGAPSPDAKQLNLSVQGIGPVVGPFVFHNITLP